MRQDYDLVGSYDNQRISSINAERSVNLFEYLDENGKRPKVLLPTSGLINADLNFLGETGGSRQTFVFNDSIYQVFGPSVFRITGTTGNLTTARIGSINNTQPYVGIDANTFQVIFVDGLQGWIWDTNANTFGLITDTGFPKAPIDVCYLDGFFLVANGGTNQFQLSEFNQGMVWSGGTSVYTVDVPSNTITLSANGDNFATGVPVTVTTTGVLPTPLALDTIYYVILLTASGINPAQIKLAATYDDAIHNIPIIISGAGSPTNTIQVSGQLQLGTITSHPGNIVACKTLHRRIFLFSENFTEVWENAGKGTNLPFRRNNSLLMEVGTPAIASVSVGFDNMFFLAQDKDGLAGVMGVRGSQSVPASNRALDFQLAQYAAGPLKGVADARGILIKENGLLFYRLNFTRANHTFVFNISMSTQDKPRWHEEEVLNGDRHPAQSHAYFNGVNYYGSYSSAIFYIVDSQIYTNDGQQIRRMRIGRQMAPEGLHRLRIDRFWVDLLQGQTQDELSVEITLDAENGDELLTESSINIILERELSGGSLGFTSTVGLDAIFTTPYPPNAQPTVFLSYSKDGGQTYGNYLHSTLGKIGDRTHRTVWRKLGTTPAGQGFVPRIEFYLPIPFVILGAAWDFAILPE